MIKSIVIGTLLIISSTIFTHAQVNEHGVDTVGRGHIDTSTVSKSQNSMAEQQLVKIKESELPTAISQKLQSNSYQDWVIQDAYRNMVLKQYSVRLKKGNQIVFYTFDAEGNKLQH